MVRLSTHYIKTTLLLSFEKLKFNFRYNSFYARRHSTDSSCFNTDIHKESISILRERFPGLRIRDNPVVGKLISPEFKLILNKDLVKFFDVFKKYNYDILIAGGAVRDLLMNKPPSNLNFATNATPKEMVIMFAKENIRLFKSQNKTYSSYGTVKVHINGNEIYEVATLRVEVKNLYSEYFFTNNWVLDAKRRDFTINAMYLDLEGKVYDWFYGCDDLRQRRMVFIGDASERIMEDYLRILRYFRFYGKIENKPDNHDKTNIAVITRNINGIQNITGPFIWYEIQHILNGNFGIDILRKMFDCGMAEHIGLPKNVNYSELTRLLNLTMGSFKSIAFHPVTILASQLHEPNDAFNLQSRLKWHAFDRDLAVFLIQHKRTYKDVNELLAYQKLLHLSTKPLEVIKVCVLELLKYNGKRDLYDKLVTGPIPRMPITNAQLDEKVAVEGKTIAQIKQRLTQIWCEHDLDITADDLLSHIPQILVKLEEEKLKDS